MKNYFSLGRLSVRNTLFQKFLIKSLTQFGISNLGIWYSWSFQLTLCNELSFYLLILAVCCDVVRFLIL